MQDDATGASPPLNRGRAADLIGRSALSAHQKLILLAYMSHLPSDRPPDSGVAWPGLDTLSTWASCSRSTAQAARAELLTAGVLVAVERGDTSMKCRLDFERLASWEPPARESRRGGAGVRQGADVRYTDDRQGADVRQGGVPNIGRGGAEHRQGGVPVFGTEPSSVIPPHQPSTDIPHQSMSGAAAPSPAGAGQLSLIGGGMEPVKPAKPTKAAREADEAARTFARLEALRLTRHSGGRGLSPARWVPEVRRALAKADAQDLVDALVWVLHDPAAAFHRGEDPRSPGPDRTTDLALVLRHPEYALRRSWWGAQAPSAEELAEEEAARAEGRPAPAWVERRAASPMGRRAAQDAERKRREDDEARAWLRANAGASGVMDDDVCF